MQGENLKLWSSCLLLSFEVLVHHPKCPSFKMCVHSIIIRIPRYNGSKSFLSWNW